MFDHEYRRMFENEDHYWWFVSRRELVLDQVARLDLPKDREAVLVDIGCGTGATASALRKYGRVVGVDFARQALAACRQRTLTELARGRAEALPLADDSVDVVVATDILEHLEDDAASLREIFRILQPGGHAVITVPAYQFLWGEHDLALMHKRRYVADELAKRAEAAGFELARVSYALCFLMPLALTRLAKRKPPTDRAPEAQIIPVSAWINSALIRFQRFETSLIRRLRLPFGLSVLAVLRKPVPAVPRGGTRRSSRALVPA